MFTIYLVATDFLLLLIIFCYLTFCLIAQRLGSNLRFQQGKGLFQVKRSIWGLWGQT